MKKCNYIVHIMLNNCNESEYIDIPGEAGTAAYHQLMSGQDVHVVFDYEGTPAEFYIKRSEIAFAVFERECETVAAPTDEFCKED